MLNNIQQNVFLMSHMTRKHITLWLVCIVCETCSKASITMKLHKEVDHKNSESITNFTFFFNRWNRLIGEKMLRSTSIRRYLHPCNNRCKDFNSIIFQHLPLCGAYFGLHTSGNWHYQAAGLLPTYLLQYNAMQ